MDPPLRRMRRQRSAPSEDEAPLWGQPPPGRPDGLHPWPPTGERARGATATASANAAGRRTTQRSKQQAAWARTGAHNGWRPEGSKGPTPTAKKTRPTTKPTTKKQATRQGTTKRQQQTQRPTTNRTQQRTNDNTTRARRKPQRPQRNQPTEPQREGRRFPRQ